MVILSKNKNSMKKRFPLFIVIFFVSGISLFLQGCGGEEQTRINQNNSSATPPVATTSSSKPQQTATNSPLAQTPKNCIKKAVTDKGLLDICRQIRPEVVDFLNNNNQL